MKNILFISSNYPSKNFPHRGTFVRNLVRSFADNGYNCVVIAPLKKGEDTTEEVDITLNESRIRVIHPIYYSFSNRKIFKYNTINLTIKSFEKAVRSIIEEIDFNPDYIYSHFLYPSGIVGVKLAKELKIPSYVAVGESGENLEKSLSARGEQKAVTDFKDVTGIIAVSKLNSNFCEKKLLIPRERIGIFPNGIEPKIFFPENKLSMRRKHGFPEKLYTLCFLGHFNERKGPHRVLKAIEGLPNVKVIFIGEGEKQLISDQIIYNNRANQETIRELFSASDIFILPTLSEGSCNAILEAMACGLPIISSKGDFNDDILDDCYSIRVDPMNIMEIRNAVLYFLENIDEQSRMAKNALISSKKFTIQNRFTRINEWMHTN